LVGSLDAPMMATPLGLKKGFKDVSVVMGNIIRDRISPPRQEDAKDFCFVPLRLCG
jgi:hypothetical protein